MSNPCDGFELANNLAKCGTKGFEFGLAVGHFLAPIIKVPLETAACVVNQYLLLHSLRLHDRIIPKVIELMKKRGLASPTRRVPLNIAIPLLQAASMEEDELLRDMWARLLVNAMDADRDVEMRRAFIDILENLTSLDVQVLETVAQACGEDAQKSVASKEIEAQLVTKGILPVIEVPGAAADADSAKTKRRNDAYAVSVVNLSRLGCIREDALASANGTISLPNVTSLGLALIAACAE